MSLRVALGRWRRKAMGTWPPRESIDWFLENGLLVIGPHSYGSPKIWRYPGSVEPRVIISDWTALAADVEIMPGGNHRLDSVASFPIRLHLGLSDFDEDGALTKGDVVIGSDVWIGRGAKILGGVTIGHGAVVAAWSVVTKNVAPYSIVAGAPARTVKKRFDADTISSLLKIAWWDWPEDLIIRRSPELSDCNVSHFIRQYSESSVS